MKRFWKWATWLSALILVNRGSPTEEPTESPTVYCYGPQYTEQIEKEFIECANGKKELNVTVQACDSENQIKLEFAIANELYEHCWRPQCVYFNMELAFRWKESWGCYQATFFGDQQCWVKAYNRYYVNDNQLRDALDVICHDTAAPTQKPTRSPSYAPTYDPTLFPTQWCGGADYTEALGQEFITCGSENIPSVTVEACDAGSQVDLYFAIANKLYDSCSLPLCVYVSLDRAFSWDDDNTCWEALTDDGMMGECFGGLNSDFLFSGHLYAALSLICSDTAPPTPEPTGTPTIFCYGAEYTEQLGNDFMSCARDKDNEVLIEACDPEDQIKLEFAIANELYEFCWRPQCVYISTEIAFRWRARGCYEALPNTGDQAQCWEKSYNSYYVKGKLQTALNAICYDTATPTVKPSSGPTQYCDGAVYNDALGDAYLACRNYSIPELEVETCDSEFQEDLEFGIANELFSNCSIAECVYSSLDYAFMWNDDDGCYKVRFNGIHKECWEDSDVFWTSGDLEAALGVICSDWAPTLHPTVYPTEQPTQIPTNTPTVSPTQIPTTTPTDSPTQIPSTTPTVSPTQIPTATPTVSPTPVPSQSPTTTPTPSPAVAPTQWPRMTPWPTFLPEAAAMTNPTQNPTNISDQWLQPTIDVRISISGIMEAQIKDTITPLSKAVNISEEFISISYWSEVSELRRLVVSAFEIDYAIQFFEDSDATEILEVIWAENFTDVFVEELALGLNIPKGNLTIDIKAVVTNAMTSKKKSWDPWTEIAIIWAIFIPLMLMIGFIGFLVRQYTERERHKFEEIKCPGETYADSEGRNRSLSRVGTKTESLLSVEERWQNVCVAGGPTFVESECVTVDGKESNFEATMLKVPEAGKRNSDENRIGIISTINEEKTPGGMPLPAKKGAKQTEAPVEWTCNDAMDREAFKMQIGMKKRNSEKISSPDQPSEGAHTVDFSNLEQKATGRQNLPENSMNPMEQSSQRDDSVNSSLKESVKACNHKRRSSIISISSSGGKRGMSVTATL